LLNLFANMKHSRNFYHSCRQCCGSMTFWCGSGSADPCLLLMDPDPAIFVINVPDTNKKLFFFKVLHFLKVHLHNFSKINSQKKVAKQKESRFFLLLLLDDRRIRIHTSERIRIRNTACRIVPLDLYWYMFPSIGARGQHQARGCDPAGARADPPRPQLPRRGGPRLAPAPGIQFLNGIFLFIARHLPSYDFIISFCVTVSASKFRPQESQSVGPA
jgi:hypothetical protein